MSEAQEKAEGEMNARCEFHVAEQVARRRPGSTAAEISKRWRQEVGIALARRTARMIRSCMPVARGQAAFIVTGHSA